MCLLRSLLKFLSDKCDDGRTESVINRDYLISLRQNDQVKDDV